MATLTVGSGQQFDSIAAAVGAAQDGDVIEVQAGTYVNDFADINVDVTLRAMGGRVHLQATDPPPNGKAILVTNGDITIEGFEFSGAEVPDRNGAGIRHEGGDLTIIDSYFHDNQMGLLTIWEDRDATLTIRGSEFAFNGAAPDISHNLYVNNIGRLVIEDSYFHDAEIGHNVKSRALETVITGSRIEDNGSDGSYSVDLPYGGRVLIADSYIQQGANSGNPAIVSFGVEDQLHPGSSLELRGNTVVNQLPEGVLVLNATGAPVTVADNDVHGLAAEQIASGPATVTGTTFLSAAPAAGTPVSGSAGAPVPPSAAGGGVPPVDDDEMLAEADADAAPDTDTELTPEDAGEALPEAGEDAPPEDVAEVPPEGGEVPDEGEPTLGESFVFGPGFADALDGALNGRVWEEHDFAALGVTEAQFDGLLAASGPDAPADGETAGEVAPGGPNGAELARLDDLLG